MAHDPDTDAVEQPWTPERAAELYRLDDWGAPYFGVSERGTVEVYPDGDRSRGIDLLDVIQGLAARGIHAPVVVRFGGILRHRLHALHAAFDAAREECAYRGRYRCVYPIKVNQQRQVCEQIRDTGATLGFGLEVGSKPELLAGLALTAGHEDMLLVCNGFKDAEFIETAILATKMGRNVLPVVERLHELELIVRLAEAHGVRPRMGIRARLASHGVGRWATSSGLRGKFGLSVAEILEAVERLRDRGAIDGLEMLHCHIGSQIYDIRTVKAAVSEVTHLYVELVRQGAPMGMLDVGGGLGVDYDGTQSPSESSVNYTLEQYATDVLYRIASICDEAGVEHPDVVTESGRAVVAHSSVLVTEVLGSRVFPDEPNDQLLAEALAGERVPQPLLDLREAFERVEEGDPVELHADAAHARDEARSLFALGYMDIVSQAAAEELHVAIGRRLLDRLGDDVPEELEGLIHLLADLYFCNVSVFQSLLDAWAIGQVFPIVPIHRLDEEPTRQGVLADITCDSDGRIERFAAEEGTTGSLRLHALREKAAGGERVPYYLGVFLVAAYQETLGDLHNLFGDTHVVHVGLRPDGRWSVEEVVRGDSVRDVLRFVQFDPEQVRETILRDVEKAHDLGRLALDETVSLRGFLEDALQGYTYLE